ncbi:MAG: 2-phosphosulfolactate phosphatase [Dehalococcoidia bacterium]|nr:2-phosphosulfolactate phosphatase [Dehalococcoidia bacterium]
MVSRIEVAAIPAEAPLIRADCYVVIDCLRATTTIATLFARGLTDLVVTDDLDQARIRGAAEGRVLFGEVGGLPPEDFDYGNSPVEVAGLNLAGARGLLYTTNGTTALCALAGRGAVVAGALANLEAVTGACQPFETVALVCAGEARGTRFGLDDFAAAAEVVNGLLARNPGAALGDLALLASRTGELDRLISESKHAGTVRQLGLGADLEFALRRDTSSAVPTVTAHGQGWALLEDRR